MSFVVKLDPLVFSHFLGCCCLGFCAHRSTLQKTITYSTLGKRKIIFKHALGKGERILFFSPPRYFFTLRHWNLLKELRRSEWHTNVFMAENQIVKPQDMMQSWQSWPWEITECAGLSRILCNSWNQSRVCNRLMRCLFFLLLVVPSWRQSKHPLDIPQHPWLTKPRSTPQRRQQRWRLFHQSGLPWQNKWASKDSG